MDAIYLYYVKHYNFPEMLNWGGHWQEHLQSFDGAECANCSTDKVCIC